MEASKTKSRSRSKKSAVTDVATAHAAAQPVASPPQEAPGAPSAAPVKPDLASRVAQAIALVEQAMKVLALESTALSAKDVQSSLKLRKGGETFVPLLAELSHRFGLEVPARPTSDMVVALGVVNALEPLRQSLEASLKVVGDALFVERSETWSTAITLYSLLKKASEREPMLATGLAPAKKFFAYRHPVVAKAHPKRKSAKAALAAKKEAEAKAGQEQQAAPPSNDPPPPEKSPAGDVHTTS
jgi:hypothetical protein